MWLNISPIPQEDNRASFRLNSHIRQRVSYLEVMFMAKI